MESKTFNIKYLENNKYLIQTIGQYRFINNKINKYWDSNLYGWIVSDKNFNIIELYNLLSKENDSKKNIKKFNNMKFKKYGKGYLLLPKNGKKDPDWGLRGDKSSNYYHGGWWRDDLEGWFFRGTLLEKLISNGASEL